MDLQLKNKNFKKSILSDLKNTIDDSFNLRMAVAFWTIDPNRVSDSLIDLLSSRDSFACVDLHQPTNVDRICDMSKLGANMYFHGNTIYETMKPRPDGANLNLPRNLLHSKILLFDKLDGSAELWVGSHNWTEYAFSFNIESSVKIALDIRNSEKDNNLYLEAANLLYDIRKTTGKVDHNFVDIYKQMQKPDTTVSTVIATSNKNFKQGDEFYIFIEGNSISKENLIIYNKIYFIINNIHFRAAIIQGGELKNKKIELEKMPFILFSPNSDSDEIFLHKASLFYDNLYKTKSKYWVTIKLVHKLTHEYLDFPRFEVNYNYIEVSNNDWGHPERTRPIRIKESPFYNMDSILKESDSSKLERVKRKSKHLYRRMILRKH